VTRCGLASLLLLAASTAGAQPTYDARELEEAMALAKSQVTAHPKDAVATLAPFTGLVAEEAGIDRNLELAALLAQAHSRVADITPVVPLTVRGIEVTRDAPHLASLRLQFLTAQGLVYHYQDALEDSLDQFDQAELLAIRLKNSLMLSRIRAYRGLLKTEFGLTDEARDDLASSVELARVLPEAYPAAEATYLWAHMTRQLGDPRGALRLYAEARGLAREGGFEQLVVLSLAGLGATELDLGNPQSALEHYREADRLAISQPQSVRGSIRQQLGTALLESGAADQALEVLEEALAIARASDGWLHELDIELAIVRHGLETGDSGLALRFAKDSVARARLHDEVAREIVALGLLADAQRQLGLWERAVETHVEQEAARDRQDRYERSRYRHLARWQAGMVQREKEALLQTQRNEFNQSIIEQQQQLQRWLYALIVISLLLAIFAAALATRWRRGRRLLQTLAHTDPLTGLSNRRRILEIAEQVYARAPEGAGLILVDIDQFKKINDRYGHAAGDRVLIAQALSIQDQCRENSRVGRLGGDEFLVVTERIPAEDLEHLAKSIVVAARNTGDLSADTPPVTVSVGVASTSRRCDVSDTLANADNALYIAKSGGRDRLAVYDGA